MKAQVNGESREFPAASLTVSELLGICKVETPDMVSVQLNGSFVDKADYDGTVVRDNDEVDFLYFMGGGTE